MKKLEKKYLRQVQGCIAANLILGALYRLVPRHRVGNGVVMSLTAAALRLALGIGVMVALAAALWISYRHLRCPNCDRWHLVFFQKGQRCRRCGAPLEFDDGPDWEL